MVIFHCYVSSPEGTSYIKLIHVTSRGLATIDSSTCSRLVGCTIIHVGRLAWSCGLMKLHCGVVAIWRETCAEDIIYMYMYIYIYTQTWSYIYIIITIMMMIMIMIIEIIIIIIIICMYIYIYAQAGCAALRAAHPAWRYIDNIWHIYIIWQRY